MTSHYEITSPHDIPPADQATRLFEEARYGTEEMADKAGQFMESASVTSQIQFLRRLTDEVEGVLDDHDSHYYGAANTTLGLLEKVANDTSGHQLLAKVAKIDSARLGHRFHNKEDRWYHDDSLLHEAIQFSKTSLPVPGDLESKLPVNTNKLEQAKMIAHDACAIYDAYYTPIGIYRVGATDVEPLAAGADSEVILKVMHEPKVRDLVNDELGLDIRVLSVDEQLHLLDYMQSGNADRYKRMIAASQRLDGAAREQFAKAFLATEFGDDFGDKLLSITEYMLSEELEAILADLEKMRVGMRQIVAWFASIDEHFAEVALKGVAERTTDIITTIEAAARQGSLQIDVVPGGGDDPASKFMYTADTQQATKDLSDMADDLATKGAMVSDEKTVVSRVVVKSDKFARFRLLNPTHGTMVMNIRPYGTRTRGDHQYEIGSYNKGVEASIGMLTNPHNRFTITGTANINDVSLRFDREGHAPNVSALDPGRSTTNQEGTIAVDVASIFSFGDPNEPATRIGRAVAAGARLRAKEMGTADNLNHNPLEDQSYGDADVFATLANGVIDKLDGLAQKTSRKKLGQVARTIVQIKDDTSLAKVA